MTEAEFQELKAGLSQMTLDGCRRALEQPEFSLSARIYDPLRKCF